LNEDLYIVYEATRQSIALLQGPAGLDMIDLRRQFADLYDHGTTDAWLEFYHWKSNTSIVPVDMALATFLDEVHHWRQAQWWFDSREGFDECFFNWLLLEYGCTPFPLSTDSIPTGKLS
jgi:hypothetical protein